MKMNYRLIHRVKSKGRLWDFGFPFLFLVVIALFHVAYPSALGGFVSRIALPFWSAQHVLKESLHSALVFFTSKATLAREVTRLTDELAQARGELLDRDLLYGEHEALKEQFGRVTKKEPRLVGTILVTPPRSPYDTAILDIGANEGVATGDLALSGVTVLGFVSTVYARTSVVDFFSTANRKTPVSILHDGLAIPVEAVGQGGGAFTATLPKEVSVSVGDAVVMPGLNPLLFSVVESIESRVTDSFAVVRFKNPRSIFTLRFLEIVKPERES